MTIELGDLSNRARDLVLEVENTKGYCDTLQTVTARLAEAWCIGSYNLDVGIVAYFRMLHPVARSLCREHGTSSDRPETMFPRSDREQAAEYFAMWFVDIARGSTDVYDDLGDAAARTIRKYRAMFTDDEWNTARLDAGQRRHKLFGTETTRPGQ